MLVRPYDLMICGCQICRPLLTAVLPASVTLKIRTYLFQRTFHKPILPDALVPPSFRLQLSVEPRFLIGVEPARARRLVAQHEQAKQSQQHGRGAFHDEHPLPASKSEPSINAEQRGGNRRPQKTGNGNGHREHSHDSSPVFSRKPVGEIENHAGEKTRLGGAKQQSHGVKRPRPDDKCRSRREKSPGDHDPGNPEPRADFLEQQVAGNFKQEIGNEKNSAAEAEHLGRHVKVLDHLKRGETHVHAVDGRKRNSRSSRTAGGAR